MAANGEPSLQMELKLFQTPEKLPVETAWAQLFSSTVLLTGKLPVDTSPRSLGTKLCGANVDSNSLRI